MKGRRTIGTWMMIVALATGAGALGAQTVLSRLGVSETHAHEISMSAIMGGYYVGSAAKPFLALAAAARSAAVGDVVGWAKAYYGSPAFKKVWADQRDNAKP